ncbi:MAG: methyl-accepting chemotaxis protein [Deferribacterales bacterium]
MYSFIVIKKIETDVYRQEALAMTSYMDQAITSTLNLCISNAVALASNDNLISSVVLEDRRAAQDILKRASDMLSDALPYTFKVHVHTEDVKSFLRAWAPDKYGDDLSSFRKSILKVKQTQAPVDALELGQAGLTMRGIVPLIQGEDYYVGSLEVMLPSDKVIEDAEIDLAVRTIVAIKAGLVPSDAGVQVGPYTVIKNEFTNQNFFDDFKTYSEDELNSPRSYFTTGNYFVVKYPLKDFSGEDIGLFYMAKEIDVVSGEIAAAKSMALIQIVITIIGFLVIFAGLIIMLRIVITPKLRALIDTTHELASGDGDLTMRIDIKTGDEFEVAADNMNQFIEKVQHTVQASLDGMLENVSASEELSATAATLSQNIAMQTEKVEQSSNLVNEVADNLDKTEELAVTTTEVLEKGRDSLQELVTNMNVVVDRIVADSESQLDLATNMHELNQQAKEIQSVLGIISDIADQTNLLALNASIEAARAGEHGRGFAVVADEVRKLAERTQTSLSDISKITTQIVGSIGGASQAITAVSESMRNASEQSGELITLADDTSRKLDETVAVSSEMVKMSTYIATKTKDMIGAMEDITNLSMENTQAGANVEQVAGTLAEKSSTVSAQLKKFKV